MKRVYNPENTKPVTEADLGSAGEYPYLRGIQKTMYRGRLWTMRQYAGYGTSAETNKRFKWLLSQGQTGLSTAFDLPTQIGLDADNPEAQGEVGRVGVHIGTVEDMEDLLSGIPLDRISISLTINATAPVLLAFYAAVAKKRGVSPQKLRGTLQNDVLKEYIARGTYIFPPRHSLRLAADAIEHAIREMPSFHPISISGYHIREAGSTAVQEIAFTFANAEVTIQSLLDRGHPIDSFAPRLSFFFGCHNNFLEEVAKFRAARRLWAKILKERYQASDPKSMALKFHAQTCGSTLTSQQPKNNIIRVALQAMAAALGGCQSLHTNAYDEALALPTEESAEIALRTQQILALETGTADTADPAGGAHAVEELTSEMESRAESLLNEIRQMGGMLKALESRFPQNQIQTAAYEQQKEIESGVQKVVGVNCYAGEASSNGQAASKILKVSPALEAKQKRKLALFKKKRDPAASRQALERLREGAEGSKNLFPLILNCVERNATLGEVCGALRSVFGEYKGY